MQDTAALCNTMQHTAIHCKTVHEYTATQSSCDSLRRDIWHMLHIATHCNTLQHTATHCNTLKHTATNCNTFHLPDISHVTTLSNPLQPTATQCNPLQHNATQCNTSHLPGISGIVVCCSVVWCVAVWCCVLQHVAVCCRVYTHIRGTCHGVVIVGWQVLDCNALQHTAAHCNTLQHAATRGNTLQHTATRCNTLDHGVCRWSGRMYIENLMYYILRAFVCGHNLFAANLTKIYYRGVPWFFHFPASERNQHMQSKKKEIYVKRVIHVHRYRYTLPESVILNPRQSGDTPSFMETGTCRLCVDNGTNFGTLGHILKIDHFKKQLSSVPVLFRNFSHLSQNCPVHVACSNFSEHYALRVKINWLSFFVFWAVLFSCFLGWWISNLSTGLRELWKPNWGGVWVGHFSNGRRFSMESSLQVISSNSFVCKHTNLSLVIRTWSWRSKNMSSTRAYLREANDKR